MKRLACVLTAALLGTASSSAQAQDAVVEGPGHEISPGTVIHPRAAIESGVDTNVFYESSNPEVSPLMRLILRFAVATQDNKPEGELELAVDGLEPSAPATPPTLDWRLDGGVAFEQYLSSNSVVRDRSNIGGDAHLSLVALPQSTVSFIVDNRFVRDTRPQNFETRGNLNRDVNRLKLGLRFRPGGGAMQFGLRYENLIDRFESAASAFANRLNHLLAARAQWQILPITRISLEASIGLFGALGSSNTAIPSKTSSVPVRVQAGVASAVTEKTTVRAHVGYANGFYAAGESFGPVIAGLEFGFRYSDQGRVTVGYGLQYTDSVNANFYRDHAIVAQIDQQIGVVLLHAQADARLRGYRSIPMAIGPASRDDVILRIVGSANYIYRDWLSFNAKLDAATDQTDYRANGFGGPIDDPSYSRVEAMVGGVAAF